MNRLKELREERGLSIRQMESKIKINHASINLYELEKREPNIKTLKKLSEFFEATIDYILCNNNYCIYAKYKEGNFMFTIREDYYKELKEKNYIYFDNNNKRCIDVNSLIGINNTYNVIELIKEFVNIDKMDALFDKKIVNDADLKALDDEIIEIELTKKLIEKIRDAIH